MKPLKLHFAAAKTPEAQAAKETLRRLYGSARAHEADIIVALGGDGLMLETLHDHLDRKTPIFGMNRGSVGFLMNAYHENDLMERLRRAERVTIHPLVMQARTRNHAVRTALAINEV